MDSNLFIAYCSLGVMAVLPIYAGSFASVRSKHAPPTTEAPEQITSSDAQWFPLIGSAVLFGLYLVFRYVPKEYVNLIVTGYFGLLGVAAFAKVLYTIVMKLSGNSAWFKAMKPYRWLFTYGNEVLQDQTFDKLNIVTFAISTIFTSYYMYSKNWITSNILGESFAFGAISLLALDNFKTGIILLSGLFFYDIFWVFGTEVMVAVAKSFDAPVKMLFPKDLFAESLQFTMLGLGDIVIPGVFVALCLRFDHSRAKDEKNYSKPYFTSCFIAYILGLITTVACMQYFQAAQPALLYLSPACVLSVLLTALVRGELGEVFNYDGNATPDISKSSSGFLKDSNGNSVSANIHSHKKKKSATSPQPAKPATKETKTSQTNGTAHLKNVKSNGSSNNDKKKNNNSNSNNKNSQQKAKKKNN